MGQFFHIKYLVAYGFGILFLRLSDYQAPSLPRCIGRVHVYSDMWRFFDNGLYRFMHRYLYEPACKFISGLFGQSNMLTRLLASSVTFLFIYIWHGRQDSTFVWTLYNFFGVTCEALAKNIGRLPGYAAFEEQFLGPKWRRRFHGLLCAPLFQMSILSNFFFFMGSQNGCYWVRRTWTDFPLGTPILFGVMYCGSITGMAIKEWEFKKKEKQH